MSAGLDVILVVTESFVASVASKLEDDLQESLLAARQVGCDFIFLLLLK